MDELEGRYDADALMQVSCCRSQFSVWRARGPVGCMLYCFTALVDIPVVATAEHCVNVIAICHGEAGGCVSQGRQDEHLARVGWRRVPAGRLLRRMRSKRHSCVPRHAVCAAGTVYY